MSMTKRQEAHIQAIIKDLERQRSRLQEAFSPLQAQMEALDDEIDTVNERLGHARALMIPLPAPEQGPGPQSAPTLGAAETEIFSDITSTTSTGEIMLNSGRTPAIPPPATEASPAPQQGGATPPERPSADF